MRVGIASKCPQMNIMKVLVHKTFYLCGFCTQSSLAVLHGIARLLGGEFWEKLKFMVFEMRGLERPQNVTK